jgi:hypothetical protein
MRLGSRPLGRHPRSFEGATSRPTLRRHLPRLMRYVSGLPLRSPSFKRYVRTKSSRSFAGTCASRRANCTSTSCGRLPALLLAAPLPFSRDDGLRHSPCERRSSRQARLQWTGAQKVGARAVLARFKSQRISTGAVKSAVRRGHAQFPRSSSQVRRAQRRG